MILAQLRRDDGYAGCEMSHGAAELCFVDGHRCLTLSGCAIPFAASRGLIAGCADGGSCQSVKPVVRVRAT
jgi:hypothetical protein